MSLSFDLNINNYAIYELEELLELPKNYDSDTIEAKENKLRQNIIADITIEPSTKNNTIQFIQNVKKRLLENLEKFSQSAVFKNYYNLDNTLKKSEIVSAGSTDIIRQPIKAYAQSMPSEFHQGDINPLAKRILRQNVNIDTRFRDNYYTTLASNFHVDLPIKFTKVLSLQLTAMELPSTFYVVSKVFKNNFFMLQIEKEPNLMVTIPDGNYDYKSLQNYLNYFLQLNGTGEYKSLNIVIDVNTPDGTPTGGSGRMVITSATNTKFILNLQTDENGNQDNITPLPLKFGWLVGFREGYYENNTSYVSEGLVNLLGPRYIYLVVDDFNNNVNDGFYGAFNSSLLNKNILARISLQGSVFTIQNQNNFNITTTPRQYFGPVDIQKLQIQLLDEYGRILNLNNMDYSFCLTMNTVYEL